ncbi:lactoylglutathione lyase [Halostagnicola larsenii XH-48]|uniref:Lactoylglutathione lyase n=1 Tax=Halostagnicola larsenii XH-48 TaxID=797299 RepID=W0JP82_9EURY|nr:VOC family protein [Halostagnicola larsenii]AHF99111.1 lactoylglutathione lyase [Halostagnicola larsenii XH-48]
MSVLRTHHVGLTVRDLETVRSFYQNVLGLSVVDAFSVSGAAFEEAVDVPEASGSFVHLESDSGDVRLELVEYEPNAPESRAESINQPGATHVSFTVADLEAFAETVPDDVETLSGPRTTASGTTIMFLRDPEGNLIEILEA